MEAVALEPRVLGAFHYHLGLLSFRQTPASAVALDALSAGRPVPDDLRTDVEVAFETGAYLHELQHFADVFGTAAGTSLISSGMLWLRKFAELCDEADWRAGHSVAWRPDAQWLAKRSDVLRGFRLALAAERAFSVPFEAFEPDVPSDELFVDVQHRADGTPSRRMIDGTRRTLVEPLGFEAFTEASAHGHVRSIIDTGFPDLSTAGEFRFVPLALDETGPGDPNTYMTVDILLTRWFRSAGIEEFPRRLVHQVIDRVLGQAHFRSDEVRSSSVAVFIKPTSTVLHGLLGGLDQHDVLANGFPEDAEALRRYVEVAAEFRSGDDWETVEGPRYFRAVRIWETWIAKHVTGPLLDLRARCKGPLLEEALADVAALVPVVVRNGSVVRCDMPPEVRTAWVYVTFMTAVLHQLATSGAAHCPRRFDTFPGLASFTNLARRGDCDLNSDMGCGSTAGALRDGRFDCLFEDVVRSSSARHQVQQAAV